MASYQIDQRGGYYDDLRAGAITSMLANINRDRKKHADPFGELDFIPWNEHHRASGSTEPVLLEDAEAQAALIERVMFPMRS